MVIGYTVSFIEIVQAVHDISWQKIYPNERTHSPKTDNVGCRRHKNNNDKWSKNFHEMRHRMSCHYWRVQCNRDSQCFSSTTIYNMVPYGPTWVSPTNRISIGSVVLAGLTCVTNRQTDTQTGHATFDICCNRPHLCNARDAADNKHKLLSPFV